MESHFQDKVRIPKGIDISVPDVVGTERGEYVSSVVDLAKKQSSWCYLFIHHSKVKSFTDGLKRDGMHYFVHTSVTYQRRKQSRGIQAVEKPTISGLVFLQGTPHDVQDYLDVSYPDMRLVRNCSTRLPAVIPHTVMLPFMRVSEVSPDRVRFLLNPFRHYAKGNVKLRITTGIFAGLEGYVIRIDRDRRLVMEVGGMSVAISGIHREKFEVVEAPFLQNKSGKKKENALVRHLTPLQERIDKDFHTPQSQLEVCTLSSVVDVWRDRAVIYQEKWKLAEAREILFFLLEEVDYHASTLFMAGVYDMTPLLVSCHQVFKEIEALTTSPQYTEELRESIAVERDECLSRFGYLVVE